ncbi:MAG: PGF-pre-PGF domain-containing protein [Euryarchaeota archaeon]|nr:PGF-pre-PGF domain-containing protein [Euryarchaeota archaeon]
MKKYWLQIYTAILVLGLLFCGTANAAPNIIGDIIPSQNSTVTGTVGQNQSFTIPLNESTRVTWTVNGISTTLPTGVGNVATFNHVFQSGSYQVTASIAGVGQIAVWDVKGTEVVKPPEETDYLYLNILSPKLNFNVIQGTPELISVNIRNSSGSRVRSSGLKYIKTSFSNGDPELQLFDDGTHGDTVAGDGIFSNQWIPTNVNTDKSPAPCILRISADHESLGFAEQIVSGTISRKPTNPDLVIEGISWSPVNPHENENIIFRITSANMGSGPSEACTVKCYISGNEVYSYLIPELKAGSNTSITFNWVPTVSGNMDIKAIVDTENKVSESNERNNEKTITFSVNSADSSSSSDSSSSDSSASDSSASDSSSSDSSSSDSSSSDSSSSSGSSGGGGGGSPEPANNVRIKELSQQFIISGKYVKFTFPKNATCITYVAFDPRRSAGKTTTIVEMLKKKSTLVPELPSGKVYENLNVWVGNKGTASPENIENAVLGFRVEKRWINSNDVDSASIKLWRFSSGKWEELSTRTSGEDDRYTYFEAETPGFSPFVITALPRENKAIEKAEEASIIPSTVPPTESSDGIEALFWNLPYKKVSDALKSSTISVNGSSSKLGASSIASETDIRITGRGVKTILVLIVLFSVTGYLGSLILRKQN